MFKQNLISVKAKKLKVITRFKTEDLRLLKIILEEAKKSMAISNHISNSMVSNNHNHSLIVL